MVYIYTMEYYSAIIKNEILSSAVKQLEWKGGHRKMNKHYILFLHLGEPRKPQYEH